MKKIKWTLWLSIIIATFVIAFKISIALFIILCILVIILIACILVLAGIQGAVAFYVDVEMADMREKIKQDIWHKQLDFVSDEVPKRLNKETTDEYK